MYIKDEIGISCCFNYMYYLHNDVMYFLIAAASDHINHHYKCVLSINVIITN